jgi:hypothetical protein
VTVTEHEYEYRITLSATSLPAGPVRLVVHNAGHVAHALSISGQGLAKLAKVADGSTAG